MKELFELQDLGYKKFHERLIPTVDPDNIIGVRNPVLRQFAKEFYNSPKKEEFMNSLPHKYYEENNLHAFLIEQIKDFDTAIEKTEQFLPYIDNWATCDSFNPKIFKKNKSELVKKLKEWLKSDKVYTVRYAIGLLMGLYLDDDFDILYPKLVAKVKSDEYYVNMMIAWYFATALSKQYESVIGYIENKELPVWIHNKTIQKAVESNRIDKDTKAYLKQLKIKVCK